MSDPNLARRIASLAEVSAGDQVVEIGAGLGSLTVPMAATGAEVLAVEFDRRLIPALSQAVAPYPNVRILAADAMKTDWPSVLRNGRWKMVSNLPYNIAVPLLLDMLAARPHVDNYLVMVQREVGERLVARPGEDAYGAVSVRVAYRSRAKLVRRVARTVFWPMPKIESVLVRLEPLVAPPVAAAESGLLALVDEGFAQRRKTMRSALRRLGLSQSRAVSILSACGLSPDVRAEDLGLTDFDALALKMEEAGG